ncbi:AAA domain-containing protein [Actinomadura scrupuli]|uniref:AAA domain-containing protein n=1 Tax=Actinomadura scrupuli TaxID=559629 RepID=UPI003D9817FA
MTTADLGGQPVSAELCEDDTAGLKALAEKLERAGEEAGPVNLKAAGWMVGQGRPSLNRVADPERYVRGYRQLKLNPSQRYAVEQAMGSEVTFIWGPPGTGKTEVVRRIVEGCYRQGLRVLFLAPTNVAVDQALERMCELFRDEPGFDEGLVQRLGDITVASLARDYGAAIDPAQVAARLTAELTTRIAGLIEELKPVRAAIAVHEQAQQASAELGALRSHADEAAAQAAAAQRESTELEPQIVAARSRIEQIGVPSGMFAQRKQAQLDQHRRDLAGWEAQAAHAGQRLREAVSQRSRCLQAIEAAEIALATAVRRLEGVPPVERLRQVEKERQEELERCEKERQKIAAAVRSRCRLLGTTVSKAVQSRKLLDTVDVVVIDEAGMVDLPSAWCAAGLAGKRVVAAGDFRQLPAVTQGSGSRLATEPDREHSRLWMDRDAFHAAGLVEVHGGVRRDPRLVSLTTQFRMRPAICAVVNEVAYPDSPLNTGRDDHSGLPASPLLESPLVLIDSAPRRIPSPRYGGHRSNPVHEAVIHELIRGLQYDTVLPGRLSGGRPTDRMGVITPYRDQVKALQASLNYRFGEAYDGLVDTVHRFQGSQRPLIVLDTVAGAGTKAGRFYEGIGLSSTTCRLLNVALSRAQDHLVVVADVDFLDRNLPVGSEAARMLDHLRRHARRLPIDDLVPFRAASDLAGLDSEELARPAFFPADEVARAVAWDIGQARKIIDIHCAFLDDSPVRTWLGHLTPRIRAGVQVVVHTRAHEAGSKGARLVAILQQAGCQVNVRDRMHEKVLIIDDTVLWHGSLNLLAGRGPTDLMMRLTDPDACSRVRRIVDRARTRPPVRTPPVPSRVSDTISDQVTQGVSPGAVSNGRLYLAVPYDEKDQAKREAGARWDKQLRLWYVPDSVARDKVRRWLP